MENNKEKYSKLIKRLKRETKLYFGGQILVLILSLVAAFQAFVSSSYRFDIFYICILSHLCLALFCIRECGVLLFARFGLAIEDCDLEMNPPLLGPVANFDIHKHDLTGISFLLVCMQLIESFIVYWTAVSNGKLDLIVAIIYILIPIWWLYEIITHMKNSIPERIKIKESIAISIATEKISKFVPEGVDLNLAEARSFKSHEEMEEFIKKTYGDEALIVEINEDSIPEDVKDMISKEIELNVEEET